MKRKFYLHIGLPKTGTTSLQVEIFSNLKNVRYLGKYAENMTVLGNVFKANPLSRFYAYCIHGVLEKDLVFQDFNEYLKNKEQERYSEINQDIPILISEECFISSFFNPIYRNKRYGFSKPDLASFLNRLNSFFDEFNYELHILFVERNPKDILLSMFLEYNWDKPKNIDLFFNNLIKSKEMQTAYSVDLLLAKNWKEFFSAKGISFNSFKFESIFSEHSFQKFFNEKVEQLNKQNALNTSKSKAKINQQGILRLMLNLLKILYRNLKNFKNDVVEELSHNKHQKEFELKFKILKTSKELDKALNELIKKK